MSLYDPGSHAKRRAYRFLPYHWRRFQRWRRTIEHDVSAHAITILVVFVMFAATLVVIILPFILGDTPTTTQIYRGAANILLACAIFLACRISWHLFFD